MVAGSIEIALSPSKRPLICDISARKNYENRIALEGRPEVAVDLAAPWSSLKVAIRTG